MKSPQRLTAAIALGLLASPMVGACNDGAAGASATLYTEIYVEPTSFRGEVPCSALPGGMKSFVGTLTDVSATGADKDPALRTGLSSSPPATCTTRVGFSSVTTNHFYVGEVDGYDRDACAPGDTSPSCIAPLGGSASGSRIMVDASGAVVPPRWTTTCGDPTIAPSLAPSAFDAPTESLYRTAVPLRGCKPMTLGGGTTAVVTTGLQLAVGQLLGALTCGDAPGTVARVEASLGAAGGVTPGGTGGEAKSAGCGGDLTFVGLSPKTTYVATVFAYEDGAGVPRWGTRCSGTAAGGLVVPAACEPLREEGTLLVEAAPLLESFGAACNAGEAALVLARVEGSLVGAGRSTVGPCAADLRFGALPRGSYTVSVFGYRLDGTEAFRVLCHGDVLPGQETRASCDAP